MNQLIQDAVFGAIRKQSWFAKNANTIVAGVGALAAILSFVATLPLPIDDQYKGIIPALVSILTAFAVKATKNGVQPSMVERLSAAAPVAASLPTYGGPSSAPLGELPQHAMDTVQDVLGQAQGVAQSFIDDAQNYIGAHRMDQ